MNDIYVVDKVRNEGVWLSPAKVREAIVGRIAKGCVKIEISEDRLVMRDSSNKIISIYTDFCGSWKKVNRR